MRAVKTFLSPGAGGVAVSDFNDPAQTMTIDAEFSGLSPTERKKLRQYLLGDRLILQKRLTVQDDQKTARQKVVAEYHGYAAEPKDWYLSTAKIEDREGGRPNWKKVADEAGITDYVETADKKVNKTSYTTGLSKYLSDHPEIEYDEPVLGETHALGLQPNLLAALPEFYLLPAITDYSDEIDRRSSSTVFRQLMGDLSDRIIKSDPRYSEIEAALAALHRLLNVVGTDEEVGRLDAIGGVETALTEIIAKLMPSVQSVNLQITVEEPKEMFSRGVTLKVHDGVLTDVLDKGHGLQRSVVFGLLQMLIRTNRAVENEEGRRPIILGIEEPELYIHPQSQRLIYNVLKEFAGVRSDPPVGSDQVLYTTHAPAFVDIGAYERIGIVRKPDLATGTIVHQCPVGALGSPDARAGFKLLTSFTIKHNELFFARRLILVEGAEDEIAIIAAARKLQLITDLPDEIGLAVVVCHNKEQIPKFQKVLNAFKIKYSVLLELDGKPETEGKNQEILSLLNGNAVAKLPDKLETVVGFRGHFPDVFYTKTFFSNPDNITLSLENAVTILTN
jgi:hypothetical protein